MGWDLWRESDRKQLSLNVNLVRKVLPADVVIPPGISGAEHVVPICIPFCCVFLDLLFEVSTLCFFNLQPPSLICFDQSKPLYAIWRDICRQIPTWLSQVSSFSLVAFCEGHCLCWCAVDSVCNSPQHSTQL